jgi:D-hexose-6-phosphate mutarotase
MHNPENRPNSKLEIVTPEGLKAIINPTGAFIETLHDKAGRDLVFPRQNLNGKDRGGIPVCAPIFGPGEQFGLNQHGFARNMEWEQIEPDDELDRNDPSIAWLKLGNPRLRPNTLPDEYQGIEMRLGIKLTSEPQISALDMWLQVKNDGEVPFLLTPGFHPYFPLSDGLNAEQIELMADGQQVSFLETGLDPAVQLPPVGKNQISFETHTHNVTIRSPELIVPVVWSQKSDVEKYICVEPTYAGPTFQLDADSRRHFSLQPGGINHYSMQIDWTDRQT